MALGGTRAQVFGLFLRQGIKLVVIGWAAGAVLAVSMLHMVRRMLAGTEGMDAGIFVTATVALLAVAVVGCAIPSRLAATLDPMAVLRME